MESSASSDAPDAHAGLVLRHQLAAAVHLDQRAVVLAADQRVAVAQPCREVRRWRVARPDELALQVVLRHLVAMVLRHQEMAVRRLLYPAVVAHAALNLER